MSGATTIARRELGSYFYSPIAYVVMVLFLLICGSLFWNDFEPGQPAAMRTLFDWMVWLLVVAVPVLCMGLLAQERSTNTIETLMTAPIDEAEVVVGKFLGSLGLLVILLIPTFLYVVMMRIYARPDIGPILSGYLGIILVGALFISIGLFCSAMTRSQIVAAVASAAILTLITIIPWWLGTKASLPPFWRKVIDETVFHRYTDFSKGLVDVGNVVFFIAATVVFLFITTKRLEFERWK